MNLFADPWKIVFLVGFAVYVAIRHIYQERVKGVERTVRRVDGTEKALLALVFVGSLIVPALFLFTSVLKFADYRLPGVLPWVGTASLIVALWLFQRSHADLGKNWSVTLELRKEHSLVTGGVYRRIRHPMYTSIFLFSLAQGLLLQNWLAGWSALATFSVLYLRRVPREEAMMLEAFGDEYREYMGRTGRLLPRP